MPPDAALVRVDDRQRADDLACRKILAEGSRSFSAAARLLPRRLGQPVAALYAFCRAADDAIDDGDDPRRALLELHRRLDRVYAGRPDDDVIERSLTRVVQAHGIARPVLDALLEGFAADARGERIGELDDLLDYSVRVASTVGVAMTLVMGVRDRDVLARASDLGIAMQLTNIARDVGEDARRGRVYLPARWFTEVGLERDAWLASPSFGPGIAAMVERTLAVADDYYRRADIGIDELPADCRAAIRAARWIYADIGRVIRDRGHDSVSHRARTSAWRKLVLVLAARLSRARGDRSLLRVPATPLAGALVDACVGVGR